MAKEIIVDGQTYVPKPEPSEWQIVIVDNRGLTFLCHYAAARTDTGLHILCDARCVMRWGTTEHLSELAANGPTNNTRISTIGRDVRVSDVVLVYDCDKKAWENYE